MAVGGPFYRSLRKGVTYSTRTGRWMAQLPGQVRRCNLLVGGQHLGGAQADSHPMSLQLVPWHAAWQVL